MDFSAAQQFARKWQQHWNAHDLDQLLDDFADDVTFTSPVAAQMMPETNGIIRGKEALRRYWTEGLRRLPDLQFEVIAVYCGVNTVVINYRNQKGGLANEVLVFSGHRVIAGHGTYAAHDPRVRATTDEWITAHRPTSNT